MPRPNLTTCYITADWTKFPNTIALTIGNRTVEYRPVAGEPPACHKCGQPVGANRPDLQIVKCKGE